ncbi:MAG: TadE/TadG family type IV pilus assembly protein [Pseudomonadota bacterium]
MKRAVFSDASHGRSGLVQRIGQALCRLGTAARAGDRIRREDGSASVQFVLVFPFFFFIFLLSFEASMLLMRQVMLERGLDLAVREIRMDSKSTASAGDMRETICNRARILPDCVENLVVELRVVDPENWVRPSTNHPCSSLVKTVVPGLPPQSVIASRIETSADWDGNRQDQFVIVRACYAVDPVMPGAPLGARLVDDLDGAYRMVASSVFVVEPDPQAPNP